MRRSCLALLLLPLLIAGCGGGDDGGGGTSTGGTTTAAASGPEEDVRAAVTAYVDASDPKAVCQDLVTAAYVEQWFAGKQAICVKQAKKALEEEDGEQEILAVDLASDTEASVEVAYTTGRIAGVKGHTTWVLDDGAWKLDDLEDDYIKSNVLVSAEATDAEGGTAALAYDPLRECVMARVEGWNAQKLRRFAIAVGADPAEAKDIFNAEMGECPAELSAYVADGISDALLEGGKFKPRYVRCIKKTMRGLLFATGLAEKALKGSTSGAGNAAILGLASGAREQCADKL